MRLKNDIPGRGEVLGVAGVTGVAPLVQEVVEQFLAPEIRRSFAYTVRKLANHGTLSKTCAFVNSYRT